MAETLIEDVAELQPYKAHLQSLGYRTTDQLNGAAEVAGATLASFLNLSKAEFDKLMLTIPRRPRPRGIVTAPRRRMPLGVVLDRVPRVRRAVMMHPMTAAPLPPKVNLISQMNDVRDQGSRGTCVAHASTAVLEHWLRSKDKVLDMSRQFLYWDCKQHDNYAGEGTWIGVAMPCLLNDGCCTEDAWKYVPDPIAGNESQGPLPDGAIAKAAEYKIASFRQLSPTAVPDIKAELAAGRCVAFSIPVFDSWYMNSEVTRTGEIVNPIPNEQESGGHAMCFVGYEDSPDDATIGGGRFYLRNSWDGNWATEPVLGTTGYGTIPYSYIARFGTEAYSIV